MDIIIKDDQGEVIAVISCRLKLEWKIFRLTKKGELTFSSKINFIYLFIYCDIVIFIYFLTLYKKIFGLEMLFCLHFVQ